MAKVDVIGMDSIIELLGRIDTTLDQIDSKMPFEERELAASNAELTTALRDIFIIATSVSLHTEVRLSNICTRVREVIDIPPMQTRDAGPNGG